MIGGRKGWIAWPAGLLCLAVLGGLVYLAAPGVPPTLDFIGQTLRTGTDASATADGADKPIDRIGTVDTDDCRSLYPNALWMQLTWRSTAVLDQSARLPETSDTAVRDALDPRVRMTCIWHEEGGRALTTTLSDVSADAAQIAGPAWASAGFDCTDLAAGGIRCAHRGDGVHEEQVIVGDRWLSTRADGSIPSGYTDALVARLWGS